MTWARRRALLLFLGFVAPVGTLVFGWSYAWIRETQLKQRVLQAQEQPGVTRHFRWEMLGLGSLVALLSTAGYLSWQVFRRTEELARERAMFVSAVSHELRTPLATLRLHAEMLAHWRGSPPGPAGRRGPARGGGAGGRRDGKDPDRARLSTDPD